MSTTTRLDRLHSLRLTDAQRVTARCGTLWVTRDGESDDLILEEGMSVALDGRTPALVTAIGAEALACVTPLPASTFAAQWRLALRRLFTPAAGVPA